MKRILVVLGLAFTVNFAIAQHKYSCGTGGSAFDGYDLVSYFDAAQPLVGKSQFSYEYDGLKLVFANQTNLNKFKKSPEVYLPAYGGWCATAVASDKYVKPDYSMYKIQNGHLLFFEVKAFFNGKTYWEKNPEANKLVADKRYTDKFE